MGTYLSTPVTDKHKESGVSLDSTTVPVDWGLVDMQGWRKSMEDAHVAVTDLPVPQHLLADVDKKPPATQDGEANEEERAMTPDAKVFGVFDGHGGAEVARFCQLYFVSVLTQQEAWKRDIQSDKAGQVGQDEGDGQVEGSAAPSDPAAYGVGHALVSSFHALDRLIHDPARRSEIYELRTATVANGESRTVDSIPSLAPSDTVSVAQNTTPADTKPPATEEDATKAIAEAEKVEKADNTSDDAASDAVVSKIPNSSDDGSSEETTDAEQVANEIDDDGGPKSDDDSLEVVGKEEASEKDQNLMDETDQDEAVEAEATGPAVVNSVEVGGSKVAGMFAKFLQLGGVAKPTGSGAEGSGSEGQIVNLNQLGRAVVAGTKTGTSASLPTIIQNGRMMCNLPEHPVHAGCTAIVAVLAGRVLTVANAGDSRAVLCRNGGVTHPLSFDHKPQQEREMNRIINAGGYVNHLGRVNGNLNLSRSIGDLKYKQVPGVSPAEQIISAEPDIKQVILEPDDEFIILGCDGIWDCLTNERAVEYVRSRIDRMTPIEIGEEMLSDIISDDPRVTQGIGGDNMTIMIIDLQPQSRKKRPSAQAAQSAEEDKRNEAAAK